MKRKLKFEWHPGSTAHHSIDASKTMLLRLAVLLSLAIAGCGSDPLPLPECEANSQRSCTDICRQLHPAATGTETCNASGSAWNECVCSCVPSCAATETACGFDGCGGSCGACPDGMACDFRSASPSLYRGFVCMPQEDCDTHVCSGAALTSCCPGSAPYCSDVGYCSSSL